MKRIIILIVVTMLIFNLVGCGQQNSGDPVSSVNEKGELVYDNGIIRTTMVEELPTMLKYNDKKIPVNSVSFYSSEKTEVYTLFIVVELSLNELTEDEIIRYRESDMGMLAYITNEANGYDFFPAVNLGHLRMTGNNTLYYVLTSSFAKENKSGFENSDISIAVSAKQDASYLTAASEEQIKDFRPQEEIHLTINTGEEPLPDINQMQPDLKNWVMNWLFEGSTEVFAADN